MTDIVERLRNAAVHHERGWINITTDLAHEAAAEIERLKVEVYTLEGENDRQASKLKELDEAAAFLDVLAHHMTRWPAVGNHLKEQQNAAADCRAMAKKLRKGTLVDVTEPLAKGATIISEGQGGGGGKE